MNKILGRFERGLAFDAIEAMDLYYGAKESLK
jgi:hypothetical protein